MDEFLSEDERAFYRNRRLASAVETIAGVLPAGTDIAVAHGARSYLTGPGSRYAAARMVRRSDDSGPITFAWARVPRALHYGQPNHAARNARWDQLAEDMPEIVQEALPLIALLDPIRREQIEHELKADLGNALSQEQLEKIWPEQTPEAIVLVERHAYLLDIGTSPYEIG